jgi:hypothetical protein
LKRSPAGRRSVPGSPARYEDSVFINCPFDEAYRQLLDSIVFAVHDCGFYGRSALEVQEAGETRLDKIMRIVQECRYGIHDLSRTELNREGLPRFNMPFELGLFLGCREYGSARDHRKQVLVLDKEKYRYQRFLSDIAGQDIADHRGDPRRAVTRVRDWLRTTSRRTTIPGGSSIWRRFQRFQVDLSPMCEAARIRPDELTFADRTQFISQWLLANAS